LTNRGRPTKGGSIYPQLTERAKRKIVGEDLLRLHGMDVEETRARLRGA
jgi:hypothetical protein